MRRADRPRRRRIDRVAKHRRCVVIIQTDPTSAAAAGATATATADPHCQACVRPVNASSLFVEDVECRQANVGDFFFIQHHLLADRIRVHAADRGAEPSGVADEIVKVVDMKAGPYEGFGEEVLKAFDQLK